MSKESSIKEYISKAKKIINDDEKLKKLIEDVLKKLKEISSDNNFSQKLMFPISLDYDKSEIRILNEVRDQLIHLGFSFSNFDENNIELDGIHPSFNHDSINLLFEELIENNILDYKESSTSLNDYLSKLMAKSKSINKR